MFPVKNPPRSVSSLGIISGGDEKNSSRGPYMEVATTCVRCGDVVVKNSMEAKSTAVAQVHN